jgi:hypothetical protein
MAHQFLTNRMTDSTYLKDVDDRYQDLEDALVYFFGLPTSGPMQRKIFNFTDVDGNIKSIIRSAGQSSVPSKAGAPGWRSRDTTTGDEFLLSCEGDYLRIFRNTGSQGSPIWVEVNKMSLTTGLWDIGSDEDTGSGCQVYDPLLEDYSSGRMVDFEFEAFDDANYWSTADRTKFIIPKDGRYRVFWNVTDYAPYDPPVRFGSIYASLYLSGVEIVDSRHGTGRTDYTGIGWPARSNTGFFHFDALLVDDYIQLGVIVEENEDEHAWLVGGRMEIERLV